MSAAASPAKRLVKNQSEDCEDIGADIPPALLARRGSGHRMIGPGPS
jgi:hypothetical protein